MRETDRPNNSLDVPNVSNVSSRTDGREKCTTGYEPGYNVPPRTNEREEMENLLRDLQADQMANMVAAVDYLQIIALYFRRKGEQEGIWEPDDLPVLERVIEGDDDDE